VRITAWWACADYNHHDYNHHDYNHSRPNDYDISCTTKPREYKELW